MHYALFSDFPSHIHVVCKYSIQAVCKLNIFLQNFRCNFLNSCENFEKPVYTVCTSLRITSQRLTHIFLFEIAKWTLFWIEAFRKLSAEPEIDPEIEYFVWEYGERE